VERSPLQSAAPDGFEAHVAALFDRHFERLYRFLDRLSGEPELAADIAQEAFARLHARGALPDRPEAWLITVAMNLFRNDKSKRARRRQLLTPARAASMLADPPAAPGERMMTGDERARVRAALDRLPERERRMLLLRAEGFSYREMATALDLNDASIGTLLARAKRGFLEAYGGGLRDGRREERDASDA
jgi:RNA polymerase sigma-70 factor (ECF subfamily)